MLCYKSNFTYITRLNLRLKYSNDEFYLHLSNIITITTTILQSHSFKLFSCEGLAFKLKWLKQ